MYLYFELIWLLASTVSYGKKLRSAPRGNGLPSQR